MKSQLSRSENSPGAMYGLSRTEVKVLEPLVRGQRRKEIAESLNLSIHTVDSHLDSAYRKLGVCNEAAAVAKLLTEHIIPD